MHAPRQHKVRIRLLEVHAEVAAKLPDQDLSLRLEITHFGRSCHSVTLVLALQHRT
jgi:hypothetical protein